MTADNRLEFTQIFGAGVMVRATVEPVWTSVKAERKAPRQISARRHPSAADNVERISNLAPKCAEGRGLHGEAGEEESLRPVEVGRRRSLAAIAPDRFNSACLAVRRID